LFPELAASEFVRRYVEPQQAWGRTRFVRLTELQRRLAKANDTFIVDCTVEAVLRVEQQALVVSAADPVDATLTKDLGAALVQAPHRCRAIMQLCWSLVLLLRAAM
jgi:hypothetical protein